jgi:hypothetical protein
LEFLAHRSPYSARRALKRLDCRCPQVGPGFRRNACMVAARWRAWCYSCRWRPSSGEYFSTNSHAVGTFKDKRRRCVVAQGFPFSILVCRSSYGVFPSPGPTAVSDRVTIAVLVWSPHPFHVKRNSQYPSLHMAVDPKPRRHHPYPRCQSRSAWSRRSLGRPQLPAPLASLEKASCSYGTLHWRRLAWPWIS